jgi:arabinose-5-phosphate isomerase
MHRRNRARSTSPVPELFPREGSGKDLSPGDEVTYGRNVVMEEVKALQEMIPLIGQSFCLAAQKVLGCKGRVVVSGMGKAGLVGTKLSATLASTGTPSLSLHPAEAFHGDLGKLVKNDVLIVLSNSGETSEILRLIPRVKQLGNTIIAITGNPDSNLARFSDIVLFIGRVLEACPIGLAPTASTTAMLAMGDALAMTVARLRNFGPEEYAFYHPGGDLGRRLLKVHEIMRSATGVTVVPLALTARETLIRMNRTPRRPGAAAVVDDDGRLVGIFTDGDLARGLERTHGFLDLPVKDAMCTDPKTIGPDALVTEALNILREHNIDQLPVVDKDRRPIGLVDVQDLIAVGMVSGY